MLNVLRYMVKGVIMPVGCLEVPRVYPCSSRSRSHRLQVVPYVCSTELMFGEPGCRAMGFSEPNVRLDYEYRAR